MKWFIFTGAIVIAMVGLGVLAVDERDVVWEGEVAKCGYCRAELNDFAVVCPDCNRSVDWMPKNEEWCDWCLKDEDAEKLRDLYEQLDVEEEPLPGALADFPIAYFLSMDEGACTYCGGMGTVLQMEAKRDCPVCRGDKRCVGCAGDRVRVRGDEDAFKRWHALLLERRRTEHLSKLTDRPIVRSFLLDKEVKAVRGYMEADLLEDSRGRELQGLAREKVESAFKALHAQLREKNGEPKAPGEN